MLRETQVEGNVVRAHYMYLIRGPSAVSSLRGNLNPEALVDLGTLIADTKNGDVCL